VFNRGKEIHWKLGDIHHPSDIVLASRHSIFRDQI
jgi:hypothetical protein